MVEKFEQSLPPAPRMTFIAALALLGGLLVAYMLARYATRTPSSTLLADLIKASVDLDRGAAIEAFGAHRLDPGVYVGVIAIVAWSIALTVVPVLPAFTVKRRLLAETSEAEARGFTALGGGSVHDVEWDLVAQLALTIPVAITGLISTIAALVRAPGLGDDNVTISFSAIWGLTSIFLATLAGIELCRRYATRRTGRVRRRGILARASVPFVCWYSAFLLILLLAFAATGGLEEA